MLDLRQDPFFFFFTISEVSFLLLSQRAGARNFAEMLFPPCPSFPAYLGDSSFYLSGASQDEAASSFFLHRDAGLWGRCDPSFFLRHCPLVEMELFLWGTLRPYYSVLFSPFLFSGDAYGFDAPAFFPPPVQATPVISNFSPHFVCSAARPDSC